MKIRNLYITEYKGLRDITLNFENNNNVLDLVVLAGVNGSGKTRVLESIYYYFEMLRSKVVSLELFYEKNENEVLDNLMSTEGLTEIEKEMQKDIEYVDCLRNIKYYNQDNLENILKYFPKLYFFHFHLNLLKLINLTVHHFFQNL